MGTNTGTIMTLANSIIGVSVLAMPFCFKQCGIILSIVMLILSSFLSRLACYFLLKSAVMARRRNFEFLAFHIFGVTGKLLVELCVIGFLMGTCIAFFVVVGDLGPAIISKTLDIPNSSSLRASVLIGLAVFVVLPLGLLRNVDSLSSICTATIGFYVCLVIKVIGESFGHLAAGDWIESVHYWRPEGLLQCAPIFSMALFCQPQLFEIYESVPNASLEKMNGIIRAAVNMCTGVYVCVGFFGYVAFCNQLFTGNILMGLSPTFMTEVIKFGFVLSVAVSFPLVIFPCRASLYSLLFRRVHTPHHEIVSSHIPEARFKCLTLFIICFSLTIGLLIPNIELVLGLVGSTIGVMTCVLFPAVAYIFVSTKHSSERLLAQIIFFVGILIMILGTYATLYAAHGPHSAVIPTSFKPEVENIRLVPPPKLEVDKSEKKLMDSENAKINKEVPNLIVLPTAIPLDVKSPKTVEIVVEKKIETRKEPPVPMEVVSVKPIQILVPIKNEVEQIKPEKENAPPANIPAPKAHIVNQINQNKDQENTVKVVKPAVPAIKEQVSAIKINDVIRPSQINEQVNQDAIKKEDDEIALAEKQIKVDKELKNKKLLETLEKHKEEQKQLLQEQKQILMELKEQNLKDRTNLKEDNKKMEGEGDMKKIDDIKKIETKILNIEKNENEATKNKNFIPKTVEEQSKPKLVIPKQDALPFNNSQLSEPSGDLKPIITVLKNEVPIFNLNLSRDMLRTPDKVIPLVPLGNKLPAPRNIPNINLPLPLAVLNSSLRQEGERLIKAAPLEKIFNVGLNESAIESEVLRKRKADTEIGNNEIKKDLVVGRDILFNSVKETVSDRTLDREKRESEKLGEKEFCEKDGVKEVEVLSRLDRNESAVLAQKVSFMLSTSNNANSAEVTNETKISVSANAVDPLMDGKEILHETENLRPVPKEQKNNSVEINAITVKNITLEVDNNGNKSQVLEGNRILEVKHLSDEPMVALPSELSVDGMFDGASLISKPMRRDLKSLEIEDIPRIGNITKPKN